MRIRTLEAGDVHAIVGLAAGAIGARRATALLGTFIERRELLVAEDHDEVVGFLAYRTDWFQCTFVTLVIVAERARRRGVARALFEAVEREAPGPRLFSSSEETNAVSIQMHRALGFIPSGFIDNLPQGYRELLYYKRLRR
ncbi:MAG TPA: GNAT family N-acetyltransferase [Candidatus Dormibacteraeota bacterium]|nr:GNAT family N-acetyltransferase [Candidatus Dormibacteraeota bacterium]